jgi:CheY-like chemotaxis protein
MQERHGLQVSLSLCDGWVEPSDSDLRAFLFEAVRELLFNVIQHSGESTARMLLRRENGTFEIRVEDDGKGFDREALREHARDRAGLGLFSIQQRLEMIGGSMSVESAPGHGTRVALRLLTALAPARAGAVADQRAGVVRTEAPGPAPARSDRIRVVIADDHRIFRQGFRALLRAEASIDVVGEAADGDEAVELARRLRPDVIVMDVSMPKMSGIEATRQIAAELPGVRVVGLSMHEDEEIAAAMREAGAVDFVTKGGPSDAAISAICAAAQIGGKKP